MTETVWIVLIIAAVIVLIAFRKRLKAAAVQFRGIKASITAQPETDPGPSAISGNLMAGANDIDAVERTTVTNNTMLGTNKIISRSASVTPAASKPPPV